MWSIIFIVAISVVPIRGSEKGTLGFVIDDTGSMGDDIRQVIDGADAITDIILNRRSSQVENLILVTFNDPDVLIRTETRNKSTFKNELRAITVNGGGDCPEMSLTGIETALNKCLVGSYLYVFTDDSPAETDKAIRVERIKYLTRNLQTQVVFVITPNNNCPASQKVFDEYYEIAAASSGQVFRLNAKPEVAQVLSYVRETVSGQRTVLTSRVIPPDVWEDIPFIIDSKTEYAVVSTSGTGVQLILSEGPTLNHERITWIDNVKVMKITSPGYYSVKVKGGGITSIVVFGRTDFTFDLGFSETIPSSLAEALKQPLLGSKSHLAIKLKNKEGDVKLEKATIIDMKGNVLSSHPLEITSEDLYVTALFEPPNMMFKVEVHGYDVKNMKSITRTSSPIETLDPLKIAIITPSVDKVPIVTIDTLNVEAEYKRSAKLKCNIHAYPKPDVIWTNVKTGEILISKVKRVNIPYDFKSELIIDSVRNNGTYQCKAINKNGEDSKNVNVTITTEPFIDLISHPNDALVEYGKEVKFTIEENSYPEAAVTWYKNAATLKINNVTELTSDKLTLLIHHMDKETEGKYICEIRNDFFRKIILFNVVLDIVPPTFVKDDVKISEVTPLRGSDATLQCRISNGKPKPEVHWYFNDMEMHIIGEYLNLTNIQSPMIGTYTCKAINIADTISHDIYLDMGEKPVLKKNSEVLTVKDGNNKSLSCEIQNGVPRPEVTWSLNGTVLKNDERYRIISDTLTFKPTIADNGIYTCEATNVYGSAHKDITLIVYSPLTIRAPNSTEINLKVNDPLILPCNADSYPRPHISWTFMKKDSTSSPMPISYMDDSIYLRIPHIGADGEGYYTCKVSSMGENTTLTYEVFVGVPAQIEKTTNTKIAAVKGDLGLTVPCKASGNPAPDVTWMLNGLLVPYDPDHFYIGEDGTLYLKNMNKLLSGDYICHAENVHGEDNQIYKITVNDYPEITYPIEKILLASGDTEKLTCNIPHKLFDRLRWYKNNKFVTEGELVLSNLKESDSGIYVCRVSNVTGFSSATKEVTVGYAPYFTSDVDLLLEYVDNDMTHLFCEAAGKPAPKIEWMHNGVKIDFTESSYTVNMELRNKDEYTCVVSNELGNKSRNFVIEMRNECLINFENDLDEYQPLILSDNYDMKFFSSIKRDRGNLRMANDDYIVLACADRFTFTSESMVTATCVEGSKFVVDGKTYNFSDLKCETILRPSSTRLDKECLGTNTETMQVGFNTGRIFVPVYEICLDIYTRTPLYASHSIEKTFSNKKPKSEHWHKEYIMPYNYESLYDCVEQNRYISAKNPSWVNSIDGCCFSKKQLVPPDDVFMGLNQIATYNYINVLPHWSTCGSENWDELERRVRNLATEVTENLIVRTGSAQRLAYKIKDSSRREQSIPRLFWKVVRDPKTISSLAIIQVNDPEIKSPNDVKELCRNICDEVEWMGGVDWKDVTRGYTYCCNTKEFERAFGLDGKFDNENDYNLIKGYVLPPGGHLLH